MGLFSGSRPTNLGIRDGRLAPSKRSPNCVSSQADPAGDVGHYVEPLRIAGNADTAWARLRKTLAEWPRATIVSDSPGYLYAEFKTPLMGFVDDVEFMQADGVVHVRSASRLGRSDFGVNRARVEAIRSRLASADAR